MIYITVIQHIQEHKPSLLQNHNEKSIGQTFTFLLYKSKTIQLTKTLQHANVDEFQRETLGLTAWGMSATAFGVKQIKSDFRTKAPKKPGFEQMLTVFRILTNKMMSSTTQRPQMLDDAFPLVVMKQGRSLCVYMFCGLAVGGHSESMVGAETMCASEIVDEAGGTNEIVRQKLVSC